MKRILTPLMSIANSMKTLGLIVRSSIPSGADLNDYVNPGTFFCGSETTAATLENCPYTDFGFKLVVRDAYGGASPGYITQELTSEARQNRYFRRRTPAGEWSTWQLTGGVDSIVEEGENTYWRYIKYSSGDCRLFLIRSISLTITNPTSSIMGGTGVNISANNTLPFALASGGYSAVGWGRAGSGIGWVNVQISGRNISGYMVSNNTVSTGNAYLTSCIICGRWE